MGFINNQGVVSFKKAITGGFRQQDAVSHHLDVGRRCCLVGKANLIAYLLAKLDLQLFGDSITHSTGGNPPRLGMANQAMDATAQCETDLGNLGSLARTGLAGNDHDLMTG